MKSVGWRREPARHALASKGIETKPKNAGSTAGKTQPRPLVASQPRAKPLSDQAKESAVDKVLAVALETAGSRDGALELLENYEWLDRTTQKIVKSQTSDAQERAALKTEVVRAIQKDADV